MSANETASSLMPLGGGFAPTPISVVTVDELLRERHVDVAKIDVEGFEEEVLNGMARTLAADPRVTLVVEYNYPLLRLRGIDPERILERLNGMGYVVREILEGGSLGPPVRGHTSLTRTCTNLLCAVPHPRIT